MAASHSATGTVPETQPGEGGFKEQRLSLHGWLLNAPGLQPKHGRIK